jgi:hypothetical protein
LRRDNTFDAECGFGGFVSRVFTVVEKRGAAIEGGDEEPDIDEDGESVFLGGGAGEAGYGRR